MPTNPVPPSVRLAASLIAPDVEQRARLKNLGAALKAANVSQAAVDQVTQQQSQIRFITGYVAHVFTQPDSVTVEVQTIPRLVPGTAEPPPIHAELVFPPNDSKLFLTELLRAQNYQLHVTIGVDVSGDSWTLTSVSVLSRAITA